MLAHVASVGQGAMLRKEYSAFFKTPGLLEPNHQIVESHIKDTRWGSLTPLQRCSRCILQPELNGPVEFVFTSC